MNIGFCGGGTIAALGKAEDIELFFDCLKKYVVNKYPNSSWELLTDRLYKRYLTYEQLDEACNLMQIAKKEFMELPSSIMNSEEISSQITLNTKRNNLYEIFERFFTRFDSCAESAKVMYDHFKDHDGYKYEPVKIIITDMPWPLYDDLRDLKEYDNLEGKPFWY